ncbi:hypothetical protein OAE88_00670 [bacterium]|nr:hypothetical protein [bacterium]
MEWYQKKQNRKGVVNIVVDHAKVIKYLDSTDWYITRFMETGIPTPADITAKRSLSRVVLNG